MTHSFTTDARSAQKTSPRLPANLPGLIETRENYMNSYRRFLVEVKRNGYYQLSYVEEEKEYYRKRIHETSRGILACLHGFRNGSELDREHLLKFVDLKIGGLTKYVKEVQAQFEEGQAKTPMHTGPVEQPQPQPLMDAKYHGDYQDEDEPYENKYDAEDHIRNV